MLPYTTTIGADITITGTTPPQNAKHLKKSSKPSLPMQTTIFKCMNDANLDAPPNQQQPLPHLYMATKSSANYNKNMVLIPITINPFACFGPMFQSFLTSTESCPQEPWFTTHRHCNNKINRPYANLMYE